MFTKERLETRVGRIPTGYAAYEAEAVEYIRPAFSAESEIGQVAISGTLDAIESEAS